MSYPERVDVSMTPETKHELNELAKANQTSLAQQARVAIQSYLAWLKQSQS
jgi:predicted transcriptional regulator